MLCGVIITVAARQTVPVVGDPWPLVMWFIAFATLAELLSVNLADSSLFEVTPSSPIYWAATCILGPIPAIVVCVISSIGAELIALSAVTLAARRGSTPAGVDGASQDASRKDWLQRFLIKVGRVWEPKQGRGFVSALASTLNYASVLVLIVGVSGIVYHLIGGRLLIQGVGSAALAHFVFPFLGLAAAAICTDAVLYGLAMVVLDPVPGVGGVRGVFLRMHLALIETAVPLIRAQVFLVVVALMLAYLFVKLGPLGFVLTSLPVVALRDFYFQWVQERSAYLDTITTLATYMQHYHPYTRGHLRRVADMSERLARELRLPAESIRHISHAGMLHDIGKIGVSEEILDKTTKLEDSEWDRIKEHPTKGAEIISHLDFLEGIVDWIKYHHKWHNGRGYPDTNGETIPVEAAIIAVADSFDAMTDDRELSVDWMCDSCLHKPEDGSRPDRCPVCGAAKRRTYREPKTLSGAIDELRRGSGSQFDPRVVKAFLAMVARDGVHLDAT